MFQAAPRRDVVAAGTIPGPIADLAALCDEMSLRFDQVAAVTAQVFHHPAQLEMQRHPVHTRGLTRHQHDVCAFGLQLDLSSTLALVALPMCCADSGMKTARAYEAIFDEGTTTTDPTVGHHPLDEERTFLVYQLHPEQDSNEAEVQATALFRLVFRNEALVCLNDNSGVDAATYAQHLPYYRLRAVYCSLERFFKPLQQLLGTQYASPVANSAEDRALRDLCDAYLVVLDGIVQSGQPKPARPLPTQQYGKEVLEERIRVLYATSEERMRRRLRVTKKTRSVTQDWRSGAFDVQYYSSDFDYDGTAVPMKTAKCCRLVMRPSRGKNFVEGDEICAFLPLDSDCAQVHIYPSAAAEKLRLWIIRGFLTAELADIHSILLELDVNQILSCCVAFFDVKGVTEADALCRIGQIAMETVEDYVQHSGNVWQVMIAVTADEGVADQVVERCQHVLECVQLSKKQQEMEELQLAVTLPTQAARRPSKLRRDTDTILPDMQASTQESAQRICALLLSSSAASRVCINDEMLFPLFNLCDTDDDGLLSVLDVSQLLLNPTTTFEVLLRNAPPSQQRPPAQFQGITGLDGCGLPFDETSVAKFVMRYCKNSTANTPKPCLTYQEFAILMLALAKL